MNIPLLEIRGVTKNFGNYSAVNNVDLNIYKGELFCLLGGSGCGKTTLINLMSGLLQSKSGMILFENEDLCKLSENQLDKIRAKNFGFIFI